MFLEYQKGNSILHRLDIRTKGLGFIVVVIAAFLFTAPEYNLIILILCLALMRHIRMPASRLEMMLKPLIPILILIILFSAVSYSPEYFQKPMSQKVLFSAGFMTCTVGGILLGISLSIRILTMVIASTLLTYSTPIDDFIHILRLMRVSHKIAFVLTTGMRFIPTMDKKSRQIIEAQRTRGANFHEGGLVRKIKAYIPVMVPMIVESLRMSENLAMAMLNRGFGASKNWTVMDELNPGIKDAVITISLLFIITLLIYLKILGYGKI
ncbi:MAG: energy-coupling factor transporter transmembrane protein EcfT [Calditrichaceae bacterium]